MNTSYEKSDPNVMAARSQLSTQATGFAAPQSSPLDSALEAQYAATEMLSDAIYRLVVRLDPVVCEMPATPNTDSAKALPSGCRLEIAAKSQAEKLYAMTTRVERLLSDLRI